jgi:putative ABC transport system substrate-binding protein
LPAAEGQGVEQVLPRVSRVPISRSTKPSEIDAAFEAIGKERAGAVIVVVDTMLLRNRTRIADHAVRQRLPTVFAFSEYADAGLLAYGPSISDGYRQAAAYVDKILKGAKPGDLPIEQPTKFELVINMKTARALGLTIPPSLQASGGSDDQ